VLLESPTDGSRRLRDGPCWNTAQKAAPSRPMTYEANTGHTPRTERVVPPAEKDAGLMDRFASENYVWYCPECNVELTRGDDAVACEDPAKCPNTEDWGGDACGYIVHTECHGVAKERRRSQ